MPYWSSSRVGAVPHPEPPKQKKRNERRSGRKGITMEDLKKQTAIRLAQEQQQKQSRAFGASSGYPVEAKGNASYQVADGKASAGGGRLSLTQAGAQAERLSYAHTKVSAAGNGGQSYQVGQSRSSEAAYRLDQYHHGSENSRGPGSPPSRIPVTGSSVRYSQDQSVEYCQRSPSTSTRTTTTSVESSSKPVGKGSGKAKLPHGLTVHELKEMTKARLQAEAAEKSDKIDGVAHPAETATLPSVMTVPSTVQVMSEYRDQVPGHSSQLSPAPPGFHSSRAQYPENNSDLPNRCAISLNRDGRSQDSRTDAWETASVSTAASDYLGGSESAFPASVNGLGPHGLEDYAVTTPFGRSRSYPTNGLTNSKEVTALDGGNGQAVVVSSNSFYESPVGYGNRRRAATLSPRPMLTHLHEDRPFVPGHDMPMLPSFSSANSKVRTLPIMTRTNPFASDPHNKYGHNAGVIGHADSNRARTSSTTSLPAMSHTAEEFALENNSARFSSQFGCLREDAPTPSSVTGLADVFREYPNGFGGAPSGLVGDLADTDLAVSTSSSIGMAPTDSFGDTRDRAATWGEPTTNMFGPGLINNSQEYLSDDLATILKLSVDDKSNDLTLYPRGSS